MQVGKKRKEKKKEGTNRKCANISLCSIRLVALSVFIQTRRRFCFGFELYIHEGQTGGGVGVGGCVDVYVCREGGGCW